MTRTFSLCLVTGVVLSITFQTAWCSRNDDVATIPASLFGLSHDIDQSLEVDHETRQGAGKAPPQPTTLKVDFDDKCKQEVPGEDIPYRSLQNVFRLPMQHAQLSSGDQVGAIDNTWHLRQLLSCDLVNTKNSMVRIDHR